MPLAGPEVGYGKNWWPTLNALEPIETSRTCAAVEQFLKDPNHPSLNLHPLEGDRTGRLHTIRATKELRILLVKEGNVCLLLEAGHHDDIYNRAPRMQFVANPHTGFVDLVEPIAPAEDLDWTASHPARTFVAERPRPLDHWTDGELAEAGCSPAQVDLIRACRTENDICELPTELFELVLEIMELTPEQWRNPSMDEEAEAEQRLRFSLVEHGALAGFTKLLGADEAAKIVAAPIEDWMVFLHPDQRTAVTRRYEGPARVRGSAGTGKTVVGLHRAAELADRYRDDPEKVLFTTFINSLPPVFEHLYERIPGTRRGDVVFVNVDKLASEVCRTSKVSCLTDRNAIDAAFASAYKAIAKPGSPTLNAVVTHGLIAFRPAVEEPLNLRPDPCASRDPHQHPRRPCRTRDPTRSGPTLMAGDPKIVACAGYEGGGGSNRLGALAACADFFTVANRLAVAPTSDTPLEAMRETMSVTSPTRPWSMSASAARSRR